MYVPVCTVHSRVFAHMSVHASFCFFKGQRLASGNFLNFPHFVLRKFLSLNPVLANLRDWVISRDLIGFLPASASVIDTRDHA